MTEKLIDSGPFAGTFVPSVDGYSDVVDNLIAQAPIAYSEALNKWLNKRGYFLAIGKLGLEEWSAQAQGIKSTGSETSGS